MRALLLSVLLLAACDRGPDRPPSALLVTLDTTRYDALTCNGAPEGVTPALDALAREGVVYDAARTVAPLTMPAHASMLTGLYPPRHTVRTNGRLALPRSAVTLAERARAAGYRTGAFVAATVLADGFGLDQGFERYDQPELQPLGERGMTYESRPAAEMADRAIAWLGELDSERPFLLWVHFFDPHGPYEPPAGFAERGGGDPYLAEVAAMDHAVGRVLDALRAAGRYDDTFVVVVGDHGEGREEHGERTHGPLLYDSTMRVPLIVRRPGGGNAGERSDEPVSVVDVYPTLVAALDLGDAGDVDGLDLLGGRVPDDRGVYFETYFGFFSYGWSPLAGWADRGGKYVHGPEPELYDVGRDPAELDDLAAARSGELDRYRSAIDRVVQGRALERTREDLAAAELAESLGDLGYSGWEADDAAPPHPLAESGLPNPRARIGAHRSFQYARRLDARQDADRIIDMYRAILAENPGNHSVWLQLSGVLVIAERYDEAIEAGRRALDHREAWHAPHKNLGLCYDRLGEPDKALEHYMRAVELAPQMVDVIDRIIALLQQTGREDEIPRYRVLRIEALEGG